MDETYPFRWEPYCCFCLFGFIDGDKVLRPSHPSEANPDGTTNPPVLFDYKTPVFNPNNHQCIPPRHWRRYKDVLPASHLSCNQNWSFVSMRRLWELVHYDFQPPLSDVNRRISILANKAASVTMPDLQKQARSRVETFLSSQTIPLSFQSNRDGRVLFVVDVFRPIWRTTVMFDGIRYLNCLSNKQDGKHFRPIKTHRGDIVNIYFASNHLGVVAMYFSKYGISKQDWPGVWWSRLTLSRTHHLLRAYTDGFKIRDLRRVESLHSTSESSPIRWSVLPPNPTAVWLCLDCSRPGITGYSACMVDGDLVDLHCHIEGEDLTFYQDGGGDRLHAVWLYFPVEQGERIFEVWRRRKRPHFCRDIPMLRTNKGRVFVLGTHISQHDIVVKYDCITSFPTEKHARFWFCYREGCVDYLAFDTEDKRLENDPIVQLEGSSALCSSGLSNQRFATSATLKDVVEVVPCRSWAPGSTGIVGLLLTYSDGHRETVGQFMAETHVRLDSDGAVLNGKVVWIGYFGMGDALLAGTRRLFLLVISIQYWRHKEGGDGRRRRQQQL
ncbi:hypothetical protein FG05_00247 [Fusarium graminearum]|nr:hypothetical protein FG05_00247 [Fusarium graminearum]